MPAKPSFLVSGIAWLVALSLVMVAGYIGWQRLQAHATAPVQQAVAQAEVTLAPHQQAVAQAEVALAPHQQAVAQAEVALEPEETGTSMVGLPQIVRLEGVSAILRKVLLHTTIPDRPAVQVSQYTVEQGDSVFEIASKFNIKPETLLWANYSQLNDNPDLISIGMELNVPPVDGVYYEWKDGDTVDSVASRFEAKVDDVLSWAGNNFDLTNPTLEPGTWIMVPGGHREFRQWIIPVIPRGAAGVSKAVYGAGACEGSYEGAFGSGTFIWPAGNHVLSGNDYWSGHLGIDIAAGEGAPIYASDSGVVVFSGWATGGYGNMVMIDHGNGYQTVYAHMNNATAGCGRSVSQGSIIGYSGSTGNSTGSHLHFEVRLYGGFVSPWYVLPAP